MSRLLGGVIFELVLILLNLDFEIDIIHLVTLVCVELC
jgi:hypothetical protein